MNRIVLAVCVLPLAVSTTFAQNSSRLCWFRAEQTCRTILITEVGYHHPLITTEREVAFETGERAPEPSEAAGKSLAWELGLLRQITPTKALGPSVLLGVGDHSRFALKLRGRQFVTQRHSVEISAGYLSTGVGSFISHRTRGFTVDARFNVEDVVSVILTYDDVSWPDPPTTTFHYLDNVERGRTLKAGLSAGSALGVASTGVIGALYLLFLYAYLRGT